jgi:alpha-L-fucosidase
MIRRNLLRHLLAAVPALSLPRFANAAQADCQAGTEPGMLPIAPGPFSPDWDSLSKYQTPDWFRDAKFGIWAHWGPQCEAEFGDWYARSMYREGSEPYRHHLKTYGHPSKFGFKDIIRRWKADRWDPDELVSLYKRAGARYFVALANHHDNFDLYDSQYQPWNSVKLGPRKDLVGGWERAARKNGLPFGVSVHAAHAWTWYELAQRADRDGPFKGVPYDGKLRLSDGIGTWWEGLDPQDLYAQNHPLSVGSDDHGRIHRQWGWGDGANLPSRAYTDKLYNRTIDLINKYDPELVYFDDTVLPLWPISDIGLKIAAHLYNRSLAKRGKLDAVINGKVLDALQRQCLVWDVERGLTHQIEAQPWQVCTCLGNWHYEQRWYDEKRYKSARMVIEMLVDVVSKNGNMLLSVPVRGNGSIDDQERAIVEDIGRWTAAEGQGIYGTRPWAVYGEGPAMETLVPLTAQGFNEGKGKPYTAEDIRFTTKGNTLFAFVMAWPATRKVTIKSLKPGTPHDKRRAAHVSLLAQGVPLPFQVTAEGLEVTLPSSMAPAAHPFALSIRMA